MAATTEIQTVNITINGVESAVPKGEMIVESIKRMGLDIPIFCYHPRMKPVGMCRMCLVETGSKGPDGSVRMMPKPQTACSLPATEGLIVVTDSEKIHNDRRGVLEFLLINHPLDCPICDRGGECPLQNNTLYYGPSTSRFIEAKRHAPKAYPLSKHVTLDLERCIQCGRCVRFTEEISGDAQLAFRFRGASMQPSTFELRDFSSKFSGNVIEICPVGALTNTTYRFRARPWDLQTKSAICTNCGNGCNIYIDYRDKTLVRVNGRTNEEINEEWTCDRGKFGHGFYNSNRRLSNVLVRQDSRLAPSSWSEAYRQIVSSFADIPGAAALIGGSSNSNEDVFSMGALFANSFGSTQVSFFAGTSVSPISISGESPTSIRDFESAKTVLVFGTSLADDEPMVYLRLRKGWVRNGTRVIVATSTETEVEEFASLVLRYRPGTEAILADALASTIKDGLSFELSSVEAQTGVSADSVTAAANLLKDLGGRVITSHKLLLTDDCHKTIDALKSLSSSVQGSFDCYPTSANGEGAIRIGRCLSSSATTTTDILQKCVDGSIKSLWVIGEDLLDYPDQDLVKSALENVDFLVVQDVLETEITSYASLVLPMSAPAEAEGTWTNIEGRVQKMSAVLSPKGDSKSAWMVASELAMRLKPSDLPFSPAEVMSSLSKSVPSFAEVDYAGLEQGTLLSYSKEFAGV